ncbi:LysR family transcriptional regulator [Pseudonocardia eucalypti]|uniref:LysR family transcriptional regulator n=1 Tax=Pseudonocardia eucalypti TaxID=648755 RepID=A0ABP9PY67_9PSEU|nr:DNA-binding transcriptional LysR family regulator [Pseudonocardia eucalypti]
MDVRRLRILRELADRGSVSAVAAALAFTPSAISQQLRTLQEEVGVTLLEPAGRGVRLTDAGRALARHADAVLAALAEADAAVEEFRSQPRGLVRMAMFSSAARLLLTGLLRRISALSQVELRFSDVDMTPSDVPSLTADFDLVVAHRDEHAAPFPSDRWEVVHLLREPLDVVLPPRHPLARRRRLRAGDLVNESWISVQEGFPVDDVLRSIALRTGTRPRVVQRINDLAVTEQVVAAGLGVALLPRYSTDHRGGRRLVCRELTGVRAARHVEAVARRDAFARPAVRAVIDALRAEVDEIRRR